MRFIKAIVGRQIPVNKECKRGSHNVRKRRWQREHAGGLGISSEQWQEILGRYGNRCLACGETEKIVRDHVVALFRGGKHEAENIQPLCYRCNLRKGLKTIDYRVKWLLETRKNT